MTRLILAALLFAAPAHAAPLIPPPQYDRPPSIPVHEYIVDGPGVGPTCTRMSGTPVHPAVRGCSWFLYGGAACVIVIARHAPGTTLELTRRHELAHCNGWVHD